MNQIKNSEIAGIDLGTTNSVLTYYDDTGKPKVIPNLDGEMITPSVVHVGEGGKEILVGTAARNMLMLEPKRTLREFKRDVGTDKVYFKEGKREISPEWAQAEVLKFLRQSAIRHFGDDRAASMMVVTVPAYFGEKERQSVKRSIELAGAQCLQLINEPTAAGLAYGLNEKQGDRLVLTLDTGGGTCDASVIQYSGGEATVLASHGDKELGGKDADEALLKVVTGRFKKEHSLKVSPETHPDDWFQIWEEVVRQKHMLSSRTEVKICARAGGKQVVIPFTRKDLAKLIKPLIDRIERVALQAITNAKVDLTDVKNVHLVGGSSRLVALQDFVKRVFGKDSILGGQVSPDLAVAEGAAIHAVKIAGVEGNSVVGESLQAIPTPAIKHKDVMPHSLGVGVQDRVSSATYCSVILERNTPLPCEATKLYASVNDQQTQFHVSVVQGEAGQPIKDCLVVGERELSLPARSQAEPTIETTMGYDESGMVQVRVKDLVSGKEEDITLDFFKKETAN